jgi:hypothetical protein
MGMGSGAVNRENDTFVTIPAQVLISVAIQSRNALILGTLRRPSG